MFDNYMQIASLLVVIATQLGIFSRYSNKMDKRLSKTDKEQNEIIEGLKNDLKSFKDYVEKRNFKSLLAAKIENTITDIIIIHKPNNAIRSLIIEGSDQAYSYFKRLYEIGYKNINIDMAEARGIQIFRALRSGHGNNLNVPDELLNKIKNDVALPALNELNFELRKIKNGEYTGTSDKKFLEIANNFVYRVTIESIELYKKNIAA